VTDVSTEGTMPDPTGGENPGNFSNPTVFSLPTSIAQIPTLGTWGMLLLAAGLAYAAFSRLRRRGLA
jgi:hypothetical protein